MELQSIMNTIDIVVILTFLFAALIGFLSGFWKSLKNFIAFAISIILLFIFSNPIAKGIANIELGFLDGGSSLLEYVIKLLADNINNGNPIEQGTEMYTTISGLALSIINIGVLISGLSIVFIIIMPLIKLIIRLIFGKEEHKKGLGMRFAGLGISCAQFIITFLIITLPIFGISSLILSYEEEIKTLSSEEETAELDEAFQTFEVIDNSKIKLGINIFNKLFKTNIETKTLGTLLTIKTDNGKLNIVNELENIQPIVKLIGKYKTDDGIDYVQLATNGRDELVYFLENTTIINVAMPVVVEYMIANDTLKESPISAEDLKGIEWKDSNKDLANIVGVVLDFIKDSSFNFDDPLDSVKNTGFPDALGNLGKALGNSSFSDLLLKTLQNVIDEQVSVNADDQVGQLLEILDFSKIKKESLETDLYNIGVIVNSLGKMGVLDQENEEIDFSDSESLEKMISAVFKVSVIKGSEKEIFEFLMDMTGFQEVITEMGLTINYNDIDWEEEAVTISNIAKSAIDLMNNVEDFDVNNLMSYIGDEDVKPYISSLLKNIAKSKMFNLNSLVPYIEQAFVDMGLDIEIDEATLPKPGEWEPEIEAILEVLQYADVLENMTEGYKEHASEIGSMLQAASNSKILKPFVNEIVNKLLNDIGYPIDKNEFDINDVTDWKTELETLVALEEKISKLSILDDIVEESNVIVEIMEQGCGTVEKPTVLVSYIVGTELKKQFKTIIKTEETFEQFMKDCDFTKANVLREGSAQVGNMLKFVYKSETLFGSASKTSAMITEFCTAYGNLETTRTNNKPSITDYFMLSLLREYDIDDITVDQIKIVSYRDEVSYLEAALRAANDGTDPALIVSTTTAVNDNTIIAKEFIKKFEK